MMPTTERIQLIRDYSTLCDHGTRARYVSGCTCVPCRAANSRYLVQRKAARKDGDTRELVDAEQVRKHLNQLSTRMTNRGIAAAARVSLSIICNIRSGAKLRVRRHIAKAILAATTSCTREQL